MCGPACQKYFHVSDQGDKGSSVRENGWLRLRLRITRGSVFVFCVREVLSHTVSQTNQPQMLQRTRSCTESYINIAGPSV